jgi:DNA-binding transcriptional regulator YbjK
MRARARLVDAAKKVFERDGFLEARIVDIAETAQIAPGSFYHYFDYCDYDFDDAVEQLTILWGNALGLEHPTGRTTK